ncbi:MAG TPA: hypothetical protein VII86_12960 [Thermoanaerobaculia bacterium]
MKKEKLATDTPKKKLRLDVETLRLLELSTALGGVEGNLGCETRLASGCA